MTVFHIVGFVVLFALANSWGGGSLGEAAKRLDERLPGRAMFWGALVCALYGFLVSGWAGAAAAAAWLLYRSLPWKLVPPGSSTPETPAEIGATFVRHLIAVVPIVPVGVWFGLPIGPGVFAFTAFAVGATFIFAVYGAQVRRAEAEGWAVEKVNRFVELGCGGLYGLAAAYFLAGGFA